MNSGLPLVSIVTPTYNQANFLPETIESVLTQDYPNIEYIVLNDGSTDDTEEILKRYDGKIYWETQSNVGQTATINKGWKMSKGSILAYLNSDDTYYVSNAISLAVDYLNKNVNTGVVYGGSVYIDGNGKELGYYNSHDFNYDEVFFTCKNPIPQPSAFIRRNVVDTVGSLDDSVYYSMDWDFWLRAGLQFRIDYLPVLLSTYRLHAESKSLAAARKAAKDTLYIYRKLFSSQDSLPESIRNRQELVWGNVYMKTAEQYFKGGDFAEARKYYLKAWKHNTACITARSIVKFLSTCSGKLISSYISDYYQRRQNKLMKLS